MPDFPRTARMWMLGAGVAAGIFATAVTTGGQTVDCTVIDEARRAVCNIKVLEALGKIKTSESSNGPFPHDAVINQQERQEWLRARYDGRIGMPTWPIPAPLLPDDAATAALLLGEWEGLQVALDGKTTTAVHYAVKTVTGITVGGTLDDKTVTGTLAGGTLRLAVAKDLAYIWVLRHTGREELLGQVRLVRSAGQGESRSGQVWLWKKLVRSPATKESLRYAPASLDVDTDRPPGESP